ncbi:MULTISPECIES: hypothetical protein [unclassified Microcoleus]|uniref:hypothetical protein n=1 Tax=unclassified Microcoleus TaxID=2642155 RepID=UPI002FD5B794
MTLANEQITDSSSNSGLSNFRITVEGLLELLDLEEEDEYGILRPTEYAFRTAIKLVVEAYDRMGNNLTKCSTGTDDQGSIRLDWTSLELDRTIRLFCPHNGSDKAYIYYHKSEEYGSEDITSAATLTHWLEWFNKI